MVRPLNVLAVSTQTLLVLSNPTALRKIVAVLQSFVFCLSVFVPSKTENDKDKPKSEGDGDPACHCGLCLEKITLDGQSAVHASCLVEILCFKVLPVNT